MNLPNIPKFTYGAAFGTTLQLVLPSPPWTYSTVGFGGGDKSGAFVREVFSQGRYGTVRMALRFQESEQAAVVAMVTALVDSAGQARWYYDSIKTPGAYWLVDVEEPAPDGGWSIEREAYPGILRASVTLRLIAPAGGATAPAPTYFPALAIP